MDQDSNQNSVIFKGWVFGLIVFIIAGIFFLFGYLLATWQTPDASDDNNSEIEIISEIKIKKDTNEPNAQKTNPIYKSGYVIKNPIIAIIENFEQIREDQKGLERADVVYEALVEGGITRFLALFLDDKEGKVGPIRSARPYLIDWADEWTGALVHIGGSNAALAKLHDDESLINIFEFEDYPVISRSDNNIPPHNAFGSLININKYLVLSHKEKTIDMNYEFKDFEDTSGDIRIVSLPFQDNDYAVKYVYDADDKHYARYNAEKKHGEIKPANIVVQFTKHETIDDIGRMDIDTKNGGKAWIFQNGRVVKGEWENNGMWTKYVDSDGKTIKFNPGPIWIQVVPNDMVINYF